MAIKIRKAKLSKDGTVEASYIDEDGNGITLKGGNICHADCKTAFAGLIPFLADLTEQKEASGIDWENIASAENVELLRYLDVTGITLTDDDVTPMVTIVGKRTLRTSKILNICAPATALSSDMESYEMCEELDIAVQRVIFEVTAYITERKWQVKQAELDFGENEDPFAEAQVTEDVAPITEEAENVA